MSETVNGPDFEASSIKLPPAAFRLETLDFDPTGHPYYKFPPFLSPPDGTPLIPFDKFEASGIEICFDSDVEEVDGEGIPTVELGTKHGAGGETEKRKRKKRSKNVDDSRKGPWWEEWGEGEDLRRADSLDPNTPRTDRFVQGAYDFQQNRHWAPILQSLYDHFRHYCGLLGHVTRNYRYGKAKGGADDDDDDDEEELIAEQEKQAQETDLVSKPFGVDPDDEEPRIREIDAEYEAELEAKELKMDAFLNDPELSMKIFFSSYYKDKGLFWSEPKLRDGPILLSFFLSFFIRNKLMPDYAKAFRKAYKVAELARLELPQTTKISLAIPDTFGSACVALWGSRLPTWWQRKNAMDIDRGSWPNSVSAPVKEWEEALKEQGVEQVGDNMDAGVQGISGGWSVPTDGVEEGPIIGGWGDGATVLEDGAAMWGAPDKTMDWAVEEEKPCLISILGPTTIPLTHAIQLVEKSTRQIISIAPPNPDDKGLGSMLGTVLFAPWKNPKEGSTVLPPELLSGLPEGSTFDMARDVIKVFVVPKTIEVLREGMGLHAVFVQVTESQVGREEVKEKKSKSRNKGKSKAKDSDDKQWWYMEFLYEVVPSFWTEEGD